MLYTINSLALNIIYIYSYVQLTLENLLKYWFIYFHYRKFKFMISISIHPSIHSLIHLFIYASIHLSIHPYRYHHNAYFMQQAGEVVRNISYLNFENYLDAAFQDQDRKIIHTYHYYLLIFYSFIFRISRWFC